MNSVTKQIAESFHCPYQVFEAGTDPEPVEQAYMEALKEGETGGFWPAILLVDEYVEYIEKALGKGNAYKMSIRPYGAVCVDEMV